MLTFEGLIEETENIDGTIFGNDPEKFPKFSGDGFAAFSYRLNQTKENTFSISKASDYKIFLR